MKTPADLQKAALIINDTHNISNPNDSLELNGLSTTFS